MRRVRIASLLPGVAVGLVAAAVIAAPALALSPAVETRPASPIGETTATLNGKVNPNGLETKYFFEYGTTTSYGTKTTEASAGSGSSAIEKSQAISGLKANTLYHYRIVASNSSGTSQGADATFTTLGLPLVGTLPAEPEFPGESATLRGFVDPNGQSTTYQFEYGTSSGAYTASVPIPAASAGSSYSGSMRTFKVTGLTPATKYFYRITATNASGQVYGSEYSFLSSKPPGIEVLPVSEVAPHGAKATVTIEPRGLATTSYLEIGTTTSYGWVFPLKEVSGSVESSTLSQTFFGLEPNTVYHYRLVAENSTGKIVSSDHTFTTLKTATLWSGGKQLEYGASLKVLGNFSFEGSTGNRSCEEAELSGELTKNPGASQTVSTLRMQDKEKLGCDWETYGYNFSVRYAAPAGGMTLNYWLNGAGEKIVRVPKFEFIQSVHLGLAKWECKYDLELAGSFSTGSPLVISLGGHTKTIAADPTWCPSEEDLYGVFTVTSNGKTVEALP